MMATQTWQWPPAYVPDFSLRENPDPTRREPNPQDPTRGNPDWREDPAHRPSDPADDPENPIDMPTREEALEAAGRGKTGDGRQGGERENRREREDEGDGGTTQRQPGEGGEGGGRQREETEDPSRRERRGTE